MWPRGAGSGGKFFVFITTFTGGSGNFTDRLHAEMLELRPRLVSYANV
jgi:hypothetical protein